MMSAPAKSCSSVFTPSPCSSSSSSPATSFCTRRHRIRQRSDQQQSTTSRSMCPPDSESVSSDPSRSGLSGSRPSFALRHSFLPFMLFLAILLLDLQAVQAAPRPDPSRSSSSPIKIPIGALFTLDSAGDVEPTGFPSWARLNANSGQIYGIPQAKDAGTYEIPLKDMNVTVEVDKEEESRCSEGIQTIWLEIVDPRRLAELSVEEQFRSLQSLVSALGVRISDLRVFPHAFLRHYRTVTETIHKSEEQPEEAEELDAEERMAFSTNISCGELTEQASDVISAAAENSLNFQVVQGYLGTKPPEPGPAPVLTKPDKGAAVEDTSDSSPPLVPVIILAVILALIIFIGVSWKIVRRAKAQRQKRGDLNGKGAGGNSGNAKDGPGAGPASPSNDSTTPMLEGNATNGAPGDGSTKT